MKVAFVSTYPKKGVLHSASSGVGSYSKNLVDSLAAVLEETDLLVFADKIGSKDDSTVGDVRVVRCWSRGLLYPFQIFSEAVKNRVDILHFQHEYFMFGSWFSALLFPFMLCLLKLLKKPTIVTLHGVIPIHVLDRQFLKDNTIRGSSLVFGWGVFIITKLISFFANGLIVHEDFLKNVLTDEYYVTGKICVIHHGIEEPSEIIDEDKAKELLGLRGMKVLLFFGYIAGYKDIELLIEAFRRLEHDERFVLIIAGGEHPRLKHDTEYLGYLRYLEEKAKNSPNQILFAGFVPENMVPIYFSAADVVVFPYKTNMASSGPLSLAIAYEKPLLVSDVLAQSVGFKDLSFPLYAEDLSKAIELIFREKEGNSMVESKAREYMRTLKKNRSWKRVAEETSSIYEQFLDENIIHCS